MPKQPLLLNRLIAEHPDLISYGTAIIICFALVKAAGALNEINNVLKLNR